MSKPKVQVIKLPRFTAFIVLSLWLYSCYEPIEGCLDIEATNFAYGADRGDSSLCIYPSLIYNFQPVYGERAFLSGTIFENDLGQMFSLSSYDFLVSNSTITSSDGNPIQSRSTYEVFAGQSESLRLVNLTEDLQQVSRNKLVVAIPNVRDVADFTKLSFDIGVPEVIHDVNSISYTDEEIPIHSYQEQYTDDGIAWLNWTLLVFRNETMIDSLVMIDTMNIHMDRAHAPISFAVDTSFTKNNGMNTSFDIQMDFEAWLDGVDFDMNAEEIAEICHKNIKKTFSLK